MEPTFEEIVEALKAHKLVPCIRLVADNYDKVSMLVAVATGLACSPRSIRSVMEYYYKPK